MELNRAKVAGLPEQAIPDGCVPTPSELDPNGHSFRLHALLHALQAMRSGDFSVRLPTECTGLEGKICDTFNEIVASNECMARELEHVGQVVGREGKTRSAREVWRSQVAHGGKWRRRSTA